MDRQLRSRQTPQDQPLDVHVITVLRCLNRDFSESGVVRSILGFYRVAVSDHELKGRVKFLQENDFIGPRGWSGSKNNALNEVASYMKHYSRSTEIVDYYLASFDNLWRCPGAKQHILRMSIRLIIHEKALQTYSSCNVLLALIGKICIAAAPRNACRRGCRTESASSYKLASLSPF